MDAISEMHLPSLAFDSIENTTRASKVHSSFANSLHLNCYSDSELVFLLISLEQTMSTETQMTPKKEPDKSAETNTGRFSLSKSFIHITETPSSNPSSSHGK